MNIVTDEPRDPVMLSTDDGDMPITPEEADFKITCTRCGHDITICTCAADWLEYRALWVAADRELQKLKVKQLDVDKVKADAQEFVDAALKDFEKLNNVITRLQEALERALGQWLLLIDGPDTRSDPRHHTEIARWQALLEASRTR